MLTLEKLQRARAILNQQPKREIYAVQVRTPRSKKKRIREKWRNDPRNYRFGFFIPAN